MTASIDASRRFVLPADSPYAKNLAALWAAEPKLAEAVEAVESQPSHPVELAKSGLPTVISTTSDGKKIHLHSRYDPLDDAKRLIDSCAKMTIASCSPSPDSAWVSRRRTAQPHR
jgi:hypothetical protein